MQVNNQVLKSIVSVVLLAYIYKAVPSLPKKVEALFDNRIFKIVFVCAAMYLVSGDLLVSVSSSLIFFAAMYLISMAVKEPFEDFTDADMEEIKNNELFSYLNDPDRPSDSIQGMMGQITEKASDVQNFYLEKCNCKQ